MTRKGRMMNDFTYGHTVSAGEFISMREAVGWCGLSERQAEAGIRNAAYVIGVRNADGKLVGMARLIGDGGYVAYIADVIVLPEYQGHGIGKTMVQTILGYIRENMREGESVMACLLAAKEKEPFYEKLNFLTRPNEQHGAGMMQWIRKNSAEEETE
ncbi:MAG: GNAT family N-acetyltransferase [Anaerofustis sp.]